MKGKVENTIVFRKKTDPKVRMSTLPRTKLDSVRKKTWLDLYNRGVSYNTLTAL